MTRRSLILAAVLLVALGVGLSVYLLGPTTPPVTPQSPNQARTRDAANVPKVTFTDVTAAAGIRFTHVTGAYGDKLLPETMGGGVAVLDYDGDGKPDLLFVNSCPWPGRPADPTATPKLYRNNGDGTFTDATAAAGLDVPLYGMGVAVGDIDNDGRPDVFVACVGKHRLFRNTDGKRFADVTDAAGVGGGGTLPDVDKDAFSKWQPPIPFGSAATFVDYDRDGRLDLFVCQYVSWSPAIDKGIGATLDGGTRSYNRPTDFDGGYCALYRNIDGKRFEDVSEAAGVRVAEREGTDANARRRPIAKALGVVACDPDGDGWPDLVVANDTVRNFFFHNVPGPDGTRTYKETASPYGMAYADEGRPRGGMGIDVADYAPDRCGVVVANFANEPLTLLRQDRPGRLQFADCALSVGLAGPSRAALKFGTFFFDYDNDGRPDLLVCNGHIEPEIATIQKSQQHAQPAQLYWNTGRPDAVFEPVSEAQAGADLFKPMVGRGAAYLDYDGDGDLDVVLVANGGPARLLRNDAPAANKSIRLDLRGDGSRANRSAIGAEVVVEAGGQKYRRSVAGARSYLSQPELVVTVGVGAAAKADKVTVRWPDRGGSVQTWTDLAAGKTHILNQAAAP